MRVILNINLFCQGGGEQEARGPSEERDGGEGEASQGDSGEIAHPGERGRFLCWLRPMKWLLATVSLCFISDSPAGEEGAREEEQHGGRSSHR